MRKDLNYQFEVSLSKDAYVNKEISNAMIGTNRDENNRKIRKQYGFDSRTGVGFLRTTVTPTSLLEYLKDGHVFCHLFTPQTIRKDGTFGSNQKMDDNFDGAWVIGIDIDETQYPSATAFIEKLSMKPTLWYTSYSNMQEGKGARFRLIYVFDNRMPSPLMFRYCASILNKKIENDTGEKIKDDCNKRCSQYFNGTNAANPNIIYNSGLTGNIYSLCYDLKISENGWIRFLRNNADYKTNSHKKEIQSILELYDFNKHITSTITNNTTTNKYNTTITTTSYSDLQKEGQLNEPVKISDTLLYDIDYMAYDDFMRFHRHQFCYVYRTETEQWELDTYQYTTPGSFQLYYNAKKVTNGHLRRMKVFERMCLRRLIKPEITPDEVIFCAYEDVHRFFDNSDRVFNGEYYRINCENAFDLQFSEIEAMYSDNIAYLREKMPKIILKRGLGLTVTERNHLMRDIRFRDIYPYLNSTKTIKENYEILVSEGFNISIRTLYNYYKVNKLNTAPGKLTDDDIAQLIDLNMSIRKIQEYLKTQNISISKDRISRIIKNKKNIINNNTTTSYNDLQKEGQLPVIDLSAPLFNMDFIGAQKAKEEEASKPRELFDLPPMPQISFPSFGY